MEMAVERLVDIRDDRGDFDAAILKSTADIDSRTALAVVEMPAESAKEDAVEEVGAVLLQEIGAEQHTDDAILPKGTMQMAKHYHAPVGDVQVLPVMTLQWLIENDYCTLISML